MLEPFTISKSRPDQIILDFERLRAEGIGHLEEMAPWIWTDFNVHDPGITILEVLCYALTDLGYRTHRIPVADLLATAPGQGNDTFYKGDEILINEPVTVLDFRKILIDLPGIRNAWLKKAEKGEIDLYVSKKLNFKPYMTGAGLDEELEAWIKELIAQEKQARVRTLLLDGIKPGTINALNKVSKVLTKRFLCKYACRAISYENNNTNEALQLNGLYDIILDLDPSINPANVKAVKGIIKKVQDKLHAHRPLCEDFLEPSIVQNMDVCLCLDMEVSEGADEQEVMAQVIYRLQEYLNPTIRFYSFKQMRELGSGCDEIFNGPLLSNGFINNTELEESELRRYIYKSDLMRLILDTKDVLAVKNLSIKLEGEAGFQSNWWCKDLGAGHTKAVLDICCSEFYVSKGVLSFKISESDLVEKLEFINLLNENIVPEEDQTPATPTGLYRPELGNYPSIQYEFPANYGIGDNNLPDNVTNTRKAQVKQLRAYLLFFDQILAAYLKTLANVRDVFSVNQGVNDPTNFYNALYEVPGVKELLKSFAEGENWETFTEDEDNSYLVALKEITSPSSIHQDRKNRLLDHMLARFGEQFNDYVLTVLRANVDPSDDPWRQPFSQYLDSKVSFLHRLPELGAERGKAYNYRAFDQADNQPDVWNTWNVAGLKKRVCLLTGIEDFRTQSLLCEPDYYIDLIQNETKQGIPIYKLHLVERNSGKVLMAGKNIRQRKKAMELREDIYQEIWKPNQLELERKEKEEKQYLRFYMNGKIVLQSKPLADEGAEYFKEKVERLVTKDECDKEGFHLIEHILLRPDDKDDETFELSFTCDPKHEIKDPYSFWITVILPEESRRFKNLNFRKYFEQVFRYETPAHVAVRFCWVDRNTLYQFEPLYKRWMEEKAKCNPDACNVTQFANKLIALLNTMPCTCDCGEPVDEPRCN